MLVSFCVISLSLSLYSILRQNCDLGHRVGSPRLHRHRCISIRHSLSVQTLGAMLQIEMVLRNVAVQTWSFGLCKLWSGGLKSSTLNSERTASVDSFFGILHHPSILQRA